MPLYFDFAVSFLLGLLWMRRVQAKPQLVSGRLSWALLSHAAFQLVVLTPIQSFSFRFHHDWAVGYVIDPRAWPRFDSWLGLWALLAAAATIAFGYLGHLVGRIPVEKPRSIVPQRALIAAAVYLLIVLAVFFKEWLYVGTYEEFFEGEARLWFVTVVGWVGLAELAACAAFMHLMPKWLAKLPDEIVTS